VAKKGRKKSETERGVSGEKEIFFLFLEKKRHGDTPWKKKERPHGMTDIKKERGKPHNETLD